MHFDEVFANILNSWLAITCCALPQKLKRLCLLRSDGTSFLPKQFYKTTSWRLLYSNQAGEALQPANYLLEISYEPLCRQHPSGLSLLTLLVPEDSSLIWFDKHHVGVAAQNYVYAFSTSSNKFYFILVRFFKHVFRFFQYLKALLRGVEPILLSRMWHEQFINRGTYHYMFFVHLPCHAGVAWPVQQEYKL